MSRRKQETPLSDFRACLYLVFKHLGLPNPTPLQYDLARYLQCGPKRKLIQAFRGVGKSLITCIYVCWKLKLDGKLNVLIVSASGKRADNNAKFIRAIINGMPLFKELRARGDQRDSIIEFDVGTAPRANQFPSVMSVGISGQMTGFRADIIIPDDVEVANNSQTHGMREKLREQIKEFAAIIKPTEEAEINYLGTPQTEMTIYNELPGRGYQIRIWPARVPDAIDRKIYGPHLSPFIAAMENVGEPTDPNFFPEVRLIEKEAEYGRSGFRLQFMLDSTLSDQERYPLKLADLLIMGLDKEKGPNTLVWASDKIHAREDLPNVGLAGDHLHRPAFIDEEFFPYTGSAMFIDPSGKGKDETGYAVVKHLNGRLFLTAAGGLIGGYAPEVLKKLASIAKAQAVNIVQIEANFGGGMFSNLLKPVLTEIGHKCTVEEVHSHTQKERRICDILEPVMNSHRLIVDEKLIEEDYRGTPEVKYQLFHQMTRMTRDRQALAHDDRIDAVAGAVGYWVESMGLNPSKAAKKKSEKSLLDMTKAFVNGVLDTRPRILSPHRPRKGGRGMVKIRGRR